MLGPAPEQPPKASDRRIQSRSKDLEETVVSMVVSESTSLCLLTDAWLWSSEQWWGNEEGMAVKKPSFPTPPDCGTKNSARLPSIFFSITQ